MGSDRNSFLLHCPDATAPRTGLQFGQRHFGLLTRRLTQTPHLSSSLSSSSGDLIHHDSAGFAMVAFSSVCDAPFMLIHASQS